MGANISVDKHVTNLQEWLEVAHKLDNIDFDGQINSHIGMWKVVENSNGQVQTIPLQFQSSTLDQIFNKNQCYVLYAIKKYNHQNPQNSDSILSTQLNLCLESIRNTIVRNSYMIPIKKNDINGNQYRIYSFFGKKAKTNLKFTATSMAIKLDQILNSTKKMSILSSGGVLRNKKLQKGSVLTLESQQQSIDQFTLKNIIKLDKDNSDIDIINFFNTQQSTTKNSSSNKKGKGLPVLNFKTMSALPEIITQKISQQKSSINCRSMSNLQDSSMVDQSKEESFLNQQKIIEANKDQKGKKMGLGKMNLKLDFSKPLNLGGFNLGLEKNTQRGRPNETLQMGSGMTNRSEQRRGKRQKCEQQCSEIIQGLYVSGEKVAKNFDTLQQHQIKHIINCAGDYCQNWFESKGISYLTFFLKDSQNQNIECLFYRVIDFIQNAHKNKENVLVHCIQGISRSITFVIAYVIFKYGYDYKKAESFVKQKRIIACPNNGFMVELIQFHKRLYDEYQSLQKPRVFLVSSHSKQTPHILTARMLKNPLFDHKKYVGFDSRALYIIHLPQIIYVWVGSKCDQKKLQNYWNFANQFIKKLQKYQRAPLKVKAISQGSEQKQFLMIWNLQEPPKLYQNLEYDRLFIDGQPARPGLQRQFYEQIQEQEAQSKKLFIFPDYKTGLGVFSFDDLNGMCILAIANQGKQEKHLTLHIWRDREFESESESADEQFLSKVIETNFSNFDDENIEIIEEDYEKPSQVFKEAFVS